jgi:23S rRNA (uridine2479-2'-O)-methyltransferase
MKRDQAVTTRDARFQQWHALLTNRNKRQRTGELLVQGVRPITLALEHGWPLTALLYDDSRQLSRWAAGLRDRAADVAVAMAPALLAELGDKTEDVPELVAVVRWPPDELGRIPIGDGFLGVVLDRPASPGNIGTLVRAADALGASGLIVAGHAADVYDPKAVRASTGSLFALPVVRVPSHREVLAWIAAAPVAVSMVALDEAGAREVGACDLVRPTLLLVGNEGAGLSAAWREAAHEMVRIPIGGAASSLNAALSGAIALYEAARQRRLR